MVATLEPRTARLAAQDQQRQERKGVNVGEAERWLSLLGGGALALEGFREGDIAGLFLAGLGGALMYRGLSGHCAGYQTLGINTAEPTKKGGVAGYRGVKVVRAVTVNRPADLLYRA